MDTTILPVAVPGVPPLAPPTDEERIESAKYHPRDSAPRVFEEDDFLFPETYGANRIRLLVKDPEWLFAYWDVDPRAMATLRADLGERAAALSRLTLRLADAEHGGAKTILLPDQARAWYIPAEAGRRSYAAELGITLPSGEFRHLATSNTITVPRTGASPEAATVRARYDLAGPAPTSTGAPAGEDTSVLGDPGPWAPAPQVLPQGGGPADSSEGSSAETKGGASDSFRPAGFVEGDDKGGASDRYRR